MAVDLSSPSIFSPAGTFTKLDVLVNVIIRNAFVLAGVISFLMLIFGGFSIIVGAGGADTKKLEQGKQAMVGAVTGLIIVVGSLWIIQILEKISGINILKPTN